MRHIAIYTEYIHDLSSTSFKVSGRPTQTCSMQNPEMMKAALKAMQSMPLQQLEAVTKLQTRLVAQMAADMT